MHLICRIVDFAIDYLWPAIVVALIVGTLLLVGYLPTR